MNLVLQAAASVAILFLVSYFLSIPFDLQEVDVGNWLQQHFTEFSGNRSIRRDPSMNGLVPIDEDDDDEKEDPPAEMGSAYAGLINIVERWWKREDNPVESDANELKKYVVDRVQPFVHLDLSGLDTKQVIEEIVKVHSDLLEKTQAMYMGRSEIHPDPGVHEEVNQMFAPIPLNDADLPPIPLDDDDSPIAARAKIMGKDAEISQLQSQVEALTTAFDTLPAEGKEDTATTVQPAIESLDGLRQKMFVQWFSTAFDAQQGTDWHAYLLRFSESGLDDLVFWVSLIQFEAEHDAVAHGYEFTVESLLKNAVGVAKQAHRRRFVKKVKGKSVRSFFRITGLPEYLENFKDLEHVDDFDELNHAELERCGIESFGHRVRILWNYHLAQCNA